MTNDHAMFNLPRPHTVTRLPGHPGYLLLTAFFSGMAVMAVELTATRLLAPYFGTSVFVWTNLLGVVMIALATGYWSGGLLGDRYPTTAWLYSLIFTASILLMLMPMVSPVILDAISSNIGNSVMSLVTSSLAGSLLLFALPFVVLGMISPAIVRLLSYNVDSSASIAGRVFSASTLGSIAGTFLPTLLLVPWIGSKRTIFLFAAILLIIALIGLQKNWLWIAAFPLLAALYKTPPGLLSGSDILYQTESPYGLVWVKKSRSGFIQLKRDQNYGVHSVYHPQKVLTGGYWDYFLVTPLFQPYKKEQSITVIGAAGGTLYRLWQQILGDRYRFRFEGAEIDPAVAKLAGSYFGASYPNLRLHTMDGRLHLRQSRQQFDVIVVDAYHNLYIPPHLSSIEFFRLARSRLTPDGVLAANVHSWLTSSAVVDRITRTIGDAFSKVWTVSVSPTNVLILATSGQGELDRARDRLPQSLHTLARNIRYKSRRIDILPPVDRITDDRPLSAIGFETTSDLF